MYPNEQPPQYSVDYLNQIAAPAPRAGFFDKKTKIIVIIIAAMLLLSLPLIAMSLLNNSGRVTADGLALQIKTLEVTSKDVHEDIGNSELRSLNSNLSLVLANAARDLGGYASIKEVEKAVAEDPSAAELAQKLDDATLNAVIDRTYPREMAYQLEITMLNIQQLYKDSDSPEFQKLLDDIHGQLQPIKEQFEDISAASS